MKRSSALILAVAAIAFAGCKPQHPSVIKVEPDFDPANVQTILVLPVISSVTEGEDPHRESERIPNRVLWERISELPEYTFQSPETYRMKVYASGLSESIEDYHNKWATDHVVDENLLRALSTMNVDMILIPLVYLWAKDEADYREAGSASATQVGMTISMVDPRTGRVMWEATDENYRESVRTEGERIQASSGGFDRRISGTTVSGKDQYAAPPFEDVVIMVVTALVDAVPDRLAPMR